MDGVQIKTEEDSSPNNIRKVCENSLRNLGVETLGMFYQHRADPNTPIEVVAETVNELIREGKVLHFGLCEVNADTIRRAHRICPVTAIQSEYHLMHRAVEDSISGKRQSSRFTSFPTGSYPCQYADRGSAECFWEDTGDHARASCLGMVNE